MQIDRMGVTLASYAPRNLLPGPLQRHIAKLSGHDYMQQALPAPEKRSAKRSKAFSPSVHEAELMQSLTEMQGPMAVVDPPAADLPLQQQHLPQSWFSDTLSIDDARSLLSDMQRVQTNEEAAESQELMAA